ncbi:hypothetical protein TWF718_009710 [Orbilia javanica]|uniref:Uncharacterized protein n=1 Tax=Orbilia javanica TaxID=47235 RepID=A0AAN8NQX4_9PEZI
MEARANRLSCHKVDSRKDYYRAALINSFLRSAVVPSLVSPITKSDVFRFLVVVGLRTPGTVEAIWSHRHQIHNLVEMWNFFQNHVAGLRNWNYDYRSQRKRYERELRRIGFFSSTIDRLLGSFEATKLFEPADLAIEYAGFRFHEIFLSELNVVFPDPLPIKAASANVDFIFICGSTLSLKSCVANKSFELLARGPPSSLSQSKSVIYGETSREETRKRFAWLTTVYPSIGFSVSVFYAPRSISESVGILKAPNSSIVGFVGEKSWRYLECSFCGFLEW